MLFKRLDSLTIFFSILFLFLTTGPSTAEENKQILIPAGTFIMGTESGTNLELPLHEVKLKAFYLDRFEITNKDYEGFEPGHRRSSSSPCDQCPVTLVNWKEALAYCTSRGARLPTEAEWEHAARGPGGQDYSFGNISDSSKGRFGLPFKSGADVVDSLKPGGFGLYHMSGNVWEWVADWLAPYPEGSVENPKGPQSGLRKVVRGGSWYNHDYYIHAGMRFGLHSKVILNSVGFRCARDRSP